MNKIGHKFTMISLKTTAACVKISNQASTLKQWNSTLSQFELYISNRALAFLNDLLQKQENSGRCLSTHIFTVQLQIINETVQNSKKGTVIM